MLRRLAAAPSFLLHFWRRSLQLRVVTATILLGVIVVTSLGGFLYFRIADGLVQDRVRAARAEAVRSARDAQSSFTAIDHTSAQRPEPVGLRHRPADGQHRGPARRHPAAGAGPSPASRWSPTCRPARSPRPSRTTCGTRSTASPRQQHWRFVTLALRGRRPERGRGGDRFGRPDPCEPALRALLRLQPPARDRDGRPGPADLPARRPRPGPAGRRGRVRRDPAGGLAGTPRRRGRRAAVLGPAAGADDLQGRGRPGPARARRSTPWRPTCRTRSAGWRSCPGSSSGSSATCRTSCGRR